MLRKIVIHTLLSLPCVLSVAAAAYTDGDLVVYAADKTQEVVFTEAQTRDRFLGSFIRWAQQDIGSIPVSEDTILFIGSSSIRLWKTLERDMAPRPVLQRGFGGSTMDSVVRFQNFFARYQAKTIVVYEGDNDLKQNEAGAVAAFIHNSEQFVQTIHAAQPDTQIYFISPKPSPKWWHLQAIYAEAHEALKAFTASDARLHYIDVATPMLNAAGQPKPEIFVNDQVHLNAAGYAIWTATVRSALGLK